MPDDSTNEVVTDWDVEANKLDDLATQQAWRLDASARVRFYKRAMLNSFQSAKENRKIFEDKIYIEITFPANRLNIIDREVTDEDKQRFRRQWLAYLQTGEQLVTGTLLSELPTITPSQIMELKALKCETVEQLAGMPDTTVQLLGTGGQQLKQRAVQFLDQRASSENLSAENRSLKADLEREIQARLDLEKRLLALENAGGVKVGETKVVSVLPQPTAEPKK